MQQQPKGNSSMHGDQKDPPTPIEPDEPIPDFPPADEPDEPHPVSGEEKSKTNREKLGVEEDHRTPEMKRNHRGTFP